jgi:hypothetical protein
MAIRREYERHVMELANSITFSLLQSVLRRQPLVLGLKNCEWDKVAAFIDALAKQ